MTPAASAPLPLKEISDSPSKNLLNILPELGLDSASDYNSAINHLKQSAATKRIQDPRLARLSQIPPPGGKSQAEDFSAHPPGKAEEKPLHELLANTTNAQDQPVKKRERIVDPRLALRR